ncbi:MAG: hypothetical protein ABFC96_06375 [Thermoguttaceae bacterium]
MAIEFHCTNCGKLLRTEDKTAGRQAQCPDCGAVMTVPGGASPGDKAFAADQQRSPLPAHPPTLDISDVLGRTWEVFRDKMSLCVLVALVPSIVSIALAFGLYIFYIAFAFVARDGAAARLLLYLGTAAVSLIVACLMVMLVRVFLKIARGQEASFSDAIVFDGTTLIALLTAVAYGLVVQVGLVFCILPGLILMAMFYPCVALVIDRRLGFGDAFTTAMKMTVGNRMSVFFIWLLANIGASVVNTLTCGLGSIITTPFLSLLYAMVYLTLAGERTAEQSKPTSIP